MTFVLWWKLTLSFNLLFTYKNSWPHTVNRSTMSPPHDCHFVNHCLKTHETINYIVVKYASWRGKRKDFEKFCWVRDPEPKTLFFLSRFKVVSLNILNGLHWKLLRSFLLKLSLKCSLRNGWENGSWVCVPDPFN